MLLLCIYIYLPTSNFFLTNVAAQLTVQLTISYPVDKGGRHHEN